MASTSRGEGEGAKEKPAKREQETPPLPEIVSLVHIPHGRTRPKKVSSAGSVIECGALDASGNRLFSSFSQFFEKDIEIFTAVEDPQRRVLYRASNLADKFKVATNMVGMYLSRRRDRSDGIYQATAFENKPHGRTGLKAGSYFLTLDACKSFDEHFTRQSRKARLSRENSIALSVSTPPASSPVSTSSPSGEDSQRKRQKTELGEQEGRIETASVSNAIATAITPPNLYPPPTLTPPKVGDWLNMSTLPGLADTAAPDMGLGLLLTLRNSINTMNSGLNTGLNPTGVMHAARGNVIGQAHQQPPSLLHLSQGHLSQTESAWCPLIKEDAARFPNPLPLPPTTNPFHVLQQQHHLLQQQILLGMQILPEQTRLTNPLGWRQVSEGWNNSGAATVTSDRISRTRSESGSGGSWDGLNLGKRSGLSDVVDEDDGDDDHLSPDPNHQTRQREPPLTQLAALLGIKDLASDGLHHQPPVLQLPPQAISRGRKSSHELRVKLEADPDGSTPNSPLYMQDVSPSTSPIASRSRSVLSAVS
jgi:hypothetical protein